MAGIRTSCGRQHRGEDTAPVVAAVDAEAPREAGQDAPGRADAAPTLAADVATRIADARSSCATPCATLLEGWIPHVASGGPLSTRLRNAHPHAVRGTAHAARESSIHHLSIVPSARRPVSITVAPCSRSIVAVANPTPLVAPVTSAFLPVPMDVPLAPVTCVALARPRRRPRPALRPQGCRGSRSRRPDGNPHVCSTSGAPSR